MQGVGFSADTGADSLAAPVRRRSELRSVGKVSRNYRPDDTTLPELLSPGFRLWDCVGL